MNRFLNIPRSALHVVLAGVALIISCKTANVSKDNGKESNEELVSEGPADFNSYDESIKNTDVVFTMVPIKGGEFLIGSPGDQANREEDEGPQKNVKVDAFWMMEAEATWDLFELFIDKDKSAKIDYGADAIKVKADAVTRPSTPYLDPSFGMGKYGYPAISMTQYAALTFCKWLSQVTGKLYRLPTEAEWEYACKAGTTTAYSFGDDISLIDEYAWYWENCDDSYHKVKQKKPNPWGLYDMHGNVSEWTLDHYQADFYATLQDGQSNPWRLPTSLYPRTVRGGSWDDDLEDLRSSARLESKRDWQKRDPQIPKSFWWNTDAPFLGFRVVRPAKEVTMEEIEEFFSMVLDE
jgi:formylglycine-generating enzyme required for sulfatase activity